MRPDLAPVAEMVRRHDHDRFQTGLFAPARKRDALFALYAFNYEIARVRETVTEPMLGQIRLQWWREVVETAYAGTAPRQHVVALALTEAIREFALTRSEFDRLIDSRERDLDPAPPSTLTALEDYAEGSSAPLAILALEVLGERSAPARAVAREVGIGYALAGLLRAIPFHAAAGRYYIPVDVAARARIDLREIRLSPGHSTEHSTLWAAVAEIAAVASRHLAAALEKRATIPRSAIAAVLPAVVASRFLARLRRVEYNPFDPQLARPDTMQAWRLALATLLRRF
jgi:NADH dehydrogenase [ubiquinone] 1 alpha subcomplex assembly factor 6